MIFRHTLKTAASGLAAHKPRSALTILGIVIGIAAVILVVSLGRGAQNLILGQIQGLGSKTIAVVPGREPKGPSDIAQTFSDSLKEKDFQALQRKENVPTLEKIMPVVFGGASASHEEETYRLTVLGVSELVGEIFDLAPERGVFFTQDDVKNRSAAVVIGAKVKDELFGESQALGERLKIKGRNFRVVGILPRKGQVSFFNFDEMALVPYTTAQQYIFGIRYFHRFLIQPRSEEEISRTVSDVKITLRNSHNIDTPDKDDFFVETQADLAQRLGTITSVLTLFLASIA
ncbi:ABC transporter permease, partial [Candidatus Giovannonibacteria bacterium]|nr:ABC transporter permease [Candidatus Giovannonibacteria bacterium]